MAFPVTLNGRTYTLADFSGTNYVDGFPDALEDFVTQAGNIYTTTSTSSVAIGTGTKTFTVADSGKPYIVGTPLRIADAAAPATNWIDAIVTSYSGTTLDVDAIAYAGGGTISSWNINIGGAAIAYTGTLPIAQGGTGGTTEAAARTNLDVYSKSEADSRFLNVSGEASDVTMTGNVTIGDAAGDTLTVNATATLADATITTTDINGGTIDGVTLGTNSAVTEAQIDNLNINGNTITSTDTDGNIALTPNGTGEVDISKVDIDGGTIDGTVIGGSTPAAISATTVTATGDVDIADKIVHTGDTNTAIRFPAADTVTVETAGTERVRVDSSGNVLVGATSNPGGGFGSEKFIVNSGLNPALFRSSASAFVGTALSCARISDGVLVSFHESGVFEGNISVNGTTVSYNGGHLSRWAQLPDGSRPELLKGTVMSNLDQMSYWEGEDNEQLNCIQVSDVEGDPNVAGVFVAWDGTGDDYNDILLAMTGDMIIRIAAGTTVQRGDLLMSAGDGTAKPQGDDIVRSKTVAKVTTTHVTCTYEDGSYCVPCVLMAC